MAIKDLPKYKDIRGSIRRKGRYPYVGTAVKDTHVIHHSLTLQHLAGSNPHAFANTHIDKNGWQGIAYAFVIMPEGTIYHCDDLDRRTNHAGNTNTRSIGTCLVGDFRKGQEKPTQAQLESLYLLNKELFKVLPNMKYVKGHQECLGYSWKNCPGDNWDYRRVINGELVTSDNPITPAPMPGQYTIQDGDTLWALSKETGITVKQLIERNPGINPKALRVGQVINLGSTSSSAPSDSGISVKSVVTVKPCATHYQSGQPIADHVKGNKYKVVQIKNVSGGNSHKAYLLDGIMTWVWEQDIIESGVSNGLENHAPATNPKKRYLVLPSSATTWTVYKLNRPPMKATPSNIAGTLKPSKFGGLEYEILHDRGNWVFEIQTGDFGHVQIYGHPSTGAAIVEK